VLAHQFADLLGRAGDLRVVVEGQQLLDQGVDVFAHGLAWCGEVGGDVGGAASGLT